MKVVLVTKNMVPVSVGAGRYCFEIVDNQLDPNIAAFHGAVFNGKEKEYDEAYNLAAWAWVHKEFDTYENH